jgi:hypothetical protein
LQVIPAPDVLLAMQKVEGSNPFSRFFKKACICGSFFVDVVGWCVCVAGHAVGTGGAARRRTRSNAVNPGVFAGSLLVTPTTDLLRDARFSSSTGGPTDRRPAPRRRCRDREPDQPMTKMYFLASS